MFCVTPIRTALQLGEGGVILHNTGFVCFTKCMFNSGGVCSTDCPFSSQLIQTVCVIDRIAELESKLQHNEQSLGRQVNDFQHKYELLC